MDNTWFVLAPSPRLQLKGMVWRGDVYLGHSGMGSESPGKAGHSVLLSFSSCPS